MNHIKVLDRRGDSIYLVPIQLSTKLQMQVRNEGDAAFVDLHFHEVLELRDKLQEFINLKSSE